MLDNPEGDGSEAVGPATDLLNVYLPHPYQVLTSDAEIQFVNDAWTELLGYDRTEIEGSRFGELLTEASRDVFETDFLDCISSGAITDARYDIVDANGDTIQITMDGRLEYDEDGTVVAAHCQFLDVSRRESAGASSDGRAVSARDATATEEPLKLAIEGAQIGVWDWDMETDEVRRDELLTNMLGYSTAEMGDRLSDWERLVHPEGEKRHNEALQEHIENKTDYYECDYRMETKSGDWKWVRTMGKIVERDDDGTPLRAVGIHQDVDEQKRNHKKLARKTDQLEALNRVVRHDIRNEMSVIYGWAQELEQRVDDDAADSVEHILDASEDVIELTELAREIVESLEEDEANLEAVTVAEPLRHELEMKREIYPKVDFSVAGELPDESVTANDLLSSVFRNLLVNAVEHNNAESPEVTIESEVTPDSVILRFADNGPGIAADSTEDIFESGEKGVESTGTGTGLYLVHSLVTEYGGDVWVEDNDPQGAVFVVELPKAE